MNTSAKNLLSLLAPVLLLTFGFLALRAGILSNHAGPGITGILCLMVGSTTLYWWLENMLLPPLTRWFHQRRELKAELELYLKDQEAYASWDDDDDNEAYGRQAYAENPGILALWYDHMDEPGGYGDDDYHLENQETTWMTIWWDEERRRIDVDIEF